METEINSLIDYFISIVDIHKVLKQASERLGELFVERQNSQKPAGDSIEERCVLLNSQYQGEEVQHRGNVSKGYALQTKHGENNT